MLRNKLYLLCGLLNFRLQREEFVPCPLYLAPQESPFELRAEDAGIDGGT
jgi:hypothetical protein